MVKQGVHYIDLWNNSQCPWYFSCQLVSLESYHHHHPHSWLIKWWLPLRFSYLLFIRAAQLCSCEWPTDCKALCVQLAEAGSVPQDIVRAIRECHEFIGDVCPAVTFNGLLEISAYPNDAVMYSSITKVWTSTETYCEWCRRGTKAQDETV